MTTLYLTRHGETEENAKRILQGLLQTKLTKKGIEQAFMLKEKLKLDVTKAVNSFVLK